MIELRILKLPSDKVLQYRYYLATLDGGFYTEWQDVEEVDSDAQGQGNKLPADGPASDSNQSGVQEASSLVEGIPDSPTDY